MTTFVTFLDDFVARNWRPTPFFGDFVTKKVTTVMSSPSFMLAVM
jgi:hypothetical protein